MLWDYTQVYNMSNHKIKIMSKCNYNFDPFVANASAALYGVENQNAVQENFHELYLKLVEHFRNPEFISKLHALKGRGQVTVAIELPMKNEAVRFANKLWFQVQKSSSLYWEVYYVNIGVNFRKSTYSPFTFKKMMLRRATVGTIEKIQDRISAADFESKMCEKLGKYVYECFSSETVNIMKRNDSETEEVEKSKNL